MTGEGARLRSESLGLGSLLLRTSMADGSACQGSSAGRGPRSRLLSRHPRPTGTLAPASLSPGPPSLDHLRAPAPPAQLRAHHPAPPLGPFLSVCRRDPAAQPDNPPWEMAPQDPLLQEVIPELSGPVGTSPTLPKWMLGHPVSPDRASGLGQGAWDSRAHALAMGAPTARPGWPVTPSLQMARSRSLCHQPFPGVPGLWRV